MALDIKRIYRNIMEDPDVVADIDTSKEEIAMDMATQRVVQHERNIQANSLGSPISKLLQFLEKADDDDEDLSPEDIKGLSDEDLGWRIQQAGMVIPDGDATEYVKNNRAEAETAFGNLSGGESAADRLAALRSQPSIMGQSARSSKPQASSDPSEEEISDLEGEGVPESGGDWEEGAEKEEEESSDEADDTEAEDEDDTDHIFHHGKYSDDDKAHIKHIREVDAAHDNKWSKAFQDLKDKVDKDPEANPKVGSPPTAVIRTTGPRKGGINIAMARKWLTQQGGDLAHDADKLSLSATAGQTTESSSRRTSRDEPWADKVSELLMEHGGEGWKYVGSGEEGKTQAGHDIAEFDRKMRKILRDNLDPDASPEEKARHEEDLYNNAIEEEAKKLGVDISSAGERPKIENIKTTPAKATAQRIVRTNKPASGSVPDQEKAGQAIEDEQKKVVQTIATDDTKTDSDKHDEIDDIHSGIQGALEALGHHVSSQVDTDKSSTDAIEEHTGKDMGDGTADDHIQWNPNTQYNHDLKNDQIIRDSSDNLYKVDRLSGYNIQLNGINEDGSWRKDGDRTINTDPTSPEYDKDTQYYPHKIGEGENAIDNHRDLIRAQAGTQTRMDLDTSPEPERSEEAPPSLHQTGESSIINKKEGTVEHAATSPDGETHYELHRHEDGSGTLRAVNAETGKQPIMVHYRTGRAGGFEAALEEHNKTMLAEGLEEHTPESADADDSDEKTPPSGESNGDEDSAPQPEQAEEQPVRHQTGDDSNLRQGDLGWEENWEEKKGKIEHAATSEDGSVHHELHRHDDGSGTVRTVYGNAREPISMHHAVKDGGFDAALEEHNQDLKDDNLDEHTPEAPAEDTSEREGSDVEAAEGKSASGAPSAGEDPDWDKYKAGGTSYEEYQSTPEGRARNHPALRSALDGNNPFRNSDPRAGAGYLSHHSEHHAEAERTAIEAGWNPVDTSSENMDKAKEFIADAHEKSDGKGPAPEAEEEPKEPRQEKPAVYSGGTKDKEGQYRFKGGAAVKGGMPSRGKGRGGTYTQMPTAEQAKAGEEGTRIDSPTPREEPEVEEEAPYDARRPKKPSEIPAGQQTLEDATQRQKAGITTIRGVDEQEEANDAKSALLDTADRTGIFEYLSDKQPFSYTSPQEARKNLAAFDIEKLKTELDRHHEKARTHMLAKQPHEEPVREDRAELEERLAKVKGTTRTPEFIDDHKHDTNDELKAAHKKLRDSNETRQKTMEAQAAAKDVSDTEKANVAKAKNMVTSMQDLPEGTGPVQAQHRMREIFNIMHKYNHVYDEKARAQMTSLVHDAVAHGANVEVAQKEAEEQVHHGGYSDTWLKEHADRAEKDQAEHDEYEKHLTSPENKLDRAEAFQRSGAETLVQTDNEGNIIGSTHTRSGFDTPFKHGADTALDHHGGHSRDDGKPHLFGKNVPPKILGLDPKQKLAQLNHHDAGQEGDTADQQRIEQDNPHLQGMGKSEAELEEERIKAGRPPGPPPRAGLEWSPNTQRWVNPDTLRGIQSGLKDGELAVMQNGLHAGTDDAHLDNPNNLSTHTAGGHRGHKNPDGSYKHGTVVVSKNGVHTATAPAGPATAKNVGPLGHNETASHAMGAAVKSHMNDNKGSYLESDGTAKSKVVVKKASDSGSHFANTGLFQSSTHTPPEPKQGRVATKIGSALKIFSNWRRTSRMVNLDKSFYVSKALQPKKKATSKDILFRSGNLSHDSKQAIRDHLRNAQVIREIEELVVR